MVKIYGKSKIRKGTYIGENVVVGYPGKDEMSLLINNKLEDIVGAIIGENCVIRDYGIIYSNTILGNNVKTGHNFLIREHTTHRIECDY